MGVGSDPYMRTKTIKYSWSIGCGKLSWVAGGIRSYNPGLQMYLYQVGCGRQSRMMIIIINVTAACFKACGASTQFIRQEKPCLARIKTPKAEL